MVAPQHIYPVDLIYMSVVIGFIVFGELVILSVRRQHRRDQKNKHDEPKS